jgi:hypothetical protein
MTIEQAEEIYKIKIPDIDKKAECIVTSEFPDFYEVIYWNKTGIANTIDVERP